MTRLNELPETPDWHPEPRTCTLDHKCGGCAPKVENEPLLWAGDNG